MNESMDQSKHNRSSTEIIADILRLLRLGNTGKTHISHFTHLNWDQALNYIDSLLEANLLESVEEEMGLPSYRITRKGLAALSLIENLKETLPPEGVTDILHRSKIIEINTGQILVTKEVAELARVNQEFAIFVQSSLDRYRQGDWGDTSDKARQLNSRFIKQNMRLFSSYESGKFPEIWITTEPDRSYSTIMFPDEVASMEPLENYRSGELKGPPQAKEIVE
jgi:predicted transcriptional regulator